MDHIQFHVDFEDWVPNKGVFHKESLSDWGHWLRKRDARVVNACRLVVYHPKPKKSLEDWM